METRSELIMGWIEIGIAKTEEESRGKKSKGIKGTRNEWCEFKTTVITRKGGDVEGGEDDFLPIHYLYQQIRPPKINTSLLSIMQLHAT